MRVLSCIIPTLFLLGACAVPFDDSRFVLKQDALVSAALAHPPAVQGQPRLWYIGLGMQSETWSENDVSETAEKLQRVATGFTVIPIIFSNRFSTLPDRYPAVDSRSVQQVTASIAGRIVPGDVVFIYASTHGAPGKLARNASGLSLAPIDADELKQWLEPLRGHQTILILSACFAGSLIPALKDDDRIIFTAARADRTSFGCRAGAEHTVFGEALLQAISHRNVSLHTIVDDTRAAVDRRERNMGIHQPSQPQVFVGATAQHFYDAPFYSELP